MPHSTFENYGLPPKLIQALVRNKFITPTPVQAETIPLALQGRDVLGSAQTGTGKTGAFGIPVIAGLMNRPDAAALIMTPTRELAGQVMAALEPMIPTVDIRTALLIGGEAMPRQFNQLRHHPRLIVGTPGRITDHLERGTLKLDNVRFLVLDETDRMLDMGFGIQIERILKYVPSDRQTLLFSATLPHNITKLSGRYMKDPVRIAVGSASTPLAKIKQEVITTTDAEKFGKLGEQLNARKGSIIIFVKTKYGTEKLAAKLNKNGHHADAIHGDLQQRRRERVIQGFRDKKYRILVATDVAARGLDIPHIEHVINYDMPQAPEDYIHRIGRTARADAEGSALSFLTPADNIKWRAIQRLIGGDSGGASHPRAHGGGGGRHSGPPRRSGGGSGGGGFGGRKPFWKKDGDRDRDDRKRDDRKRDDRPHREHSSSDRPRSDRPHGERSGGERAEGERSYHPKPWGDKARQDKPRGGPHGERPQGERSHSDRPRSDRPHSDRPHADRHPGERPHGGKPAGARKFGGKPFRHKPHKTA